MIFIDLLMRYEDDERTKVEPSVTSKSHCDSGPLMIDPLPAPEWNSRIRKRTDGATNQRGKSYVGGPNRSMRLAVPFRVLGKGP